MNRINLILQKLDENPVSFARNLGLSKELIYMIQKGNRKISKKLANKIQEIYGIPFKYTYNGEGELVIDDRLKISVPVTNTEYIEQELDYYKKKVMDLQQQRLEDKEEIIKLQKLLYDKSPKTNKDIDVEQQP